MGYTKPDEVRSYTGVRPDQLGLETDQKLDQLLQTWADQVKDVIDKDRNQSFGDAPDDATGLVRNVSMRMLANMVGYAMLRRETSFIRVDDWSVRTIPDDILTSGIRRDLRRIPKKPRFRFMRVGGVNDE